MQGQPWRGTGAGFFVLAKFRQKCELKKKRKKRHTTEVILDGFNC
jgi:hypothetical protein